MCYDSWPHTHRVWLVHRGEKISFIIHLCFTLEAIHKLYFTYPLFTTLLFSLIKSALSIFCILWYFISLSFNKKLYYCIPSFVISITRRFYDIRGYSAISTVGIFRFRPAAYVSYSFFSRTYVSGFLGD